MFVLAQCYKKGQRIKEFIDYCYSQIYQKLENIWQDHTQLPQTV